VRTVPVIGLACAAVLASCDSTGPEQVQRVKLAPSAADDQVAQIGEPVSVSVHATDSRGKSVGGVTVLWEVNSGAGTVEPTSVQTSANGIASAELRVGSGENRVSARAQGSTSAINFVAFGCSRCGEWTLVPVGLAADARAWASSATLDGKIWIVGGERWPTQSTTGVNVFDPATTTWRRVAEFASPVSASVAAVVDRKLYIIGGVAQSQQGSASVMALDVSTGQWSAKAPLTLGRYYAAGAVLDGKIYVVGGHDWCNFDWCPNGPLSSLEIYDPTTDRWTNGPPMVFARAIASAAAVNGKLVVAAGTNGELFEFDGPISSVEMFDPDAGRWAIRADLPVAGPVHLAVMKGTLYAFAPNIERQSMLTYEYDAARDAWIRLRDAPTLLYGGVFAAVDDAVYAIGGYSSATNMPFVRHMSSSVYVMRR
jgi:N-acetylneuraminic acid mutarotase